MRFGVCTPFKNSAAVKAAGWDYIEINVRKSLQPTVADDQWTAKSEIQSAGLPTPSASSLMPGEIKLVGPSVDAAAIDSYMNTVFRRAKIVGLATIVFGSGDSRNVPDGFDRNIARKQILEFCRRQADTAAKFDVTLVIEPLNRGETNIINSVGEAMTYVHEVNHPNLQCLVDSYHMWLEKEPLENLRAAMPWIKHVHVADDVTRVPPGVEGKSDYRALFKVLKEGKYDRLISVESFSNSQIMPYDKQVLDFLKREWHAA